MRILLTGTYNSHNKGDATMELVARDRIAAALTDAEVVISSPFPGLDEPFYAPTKVVTCSRRQLIRASFELLAALLWRTLHATTGRDHSALLIGETLRETRHADLVVDLSGDMLTESSGPHVAYSHFIPLLRALFVGTPYLLCAQSIGPFKLTRPPRALPVAPGSRHHCARGGQPRLPDLARTLAGANPPDRRLGLPARAGTG